MKKGRVVLVRGDDRYANVLQALEAIDGDMDLAGKRRIVVKPNFVSVRQPLSATHVDAMRAVLDFLRARGVRDVTLAEGPAVGTLREGLRVFGYEDLVREHGLRLVDLNDDEGVEVEVYDRDFHPLRLPVARTTIESDYRISVGPPKTHDLVIVTLSLKNWAVGSLTAGNKSRCHQGYVGTHLNLYKLAYHVAPHLAVLDGFQAMEGNGPTSGDPVDWRIALASTDFVAADSLCAHLMGFEPEDVGYLHYCHLKGLGEGRPEVMEVVGNATVAQVRRVFKPHASYERQKGWRMAGIERYL